MKMLNSIIDAFPVFEILISPWNEFGLTWTRDGEKGGGGGDDVIIKR